MPLASLASLALLAYVAWSACALLVVCGAEVNALIHDSRAALRVLAWGIGACDLCGGRLLALLCVDGAEGELEIVQLSLELGERP